MAKGFDKGKSGNPQGRPKGVENKVSQDARALFLSTLEGQVPNINKAFNDVKDIDPAKYLDLFCKYAQYFMPKKVDVTTDGDKLNQFDLKTTVETFLHGGNDKTETSPS